MAELPFIFRILGTPTKLFYEAFRHTQKVVTGDVAEGLDSEDDTSPFVGFRISLLLGTVALFGVFQTLDLRTPFFVILSFTGLSCAWQLRPFWRAAKVMSGRVPRPDLANWVLSHHAATSVVLEAVGNGAMALGLGTAGFFDKWDGRAALGVVLILLWVPFNRFIFINLAVLELLKQHVASALRFVVFRRFQSENSRKEEGFDKRHRQIILPVLGAFGKVTVVHNPSLAATKPGPNSDSEEINAQAKQAIAFDHDEWVHGVSELIRDSDIAVFHWGSELSESMLLELRLSERLLTPRRMILVVDGDAGALFELCQKGFDIAITVADLKGGYGGFLVQLRSAIKEMATSPVDQPKSDPKVPKWNGAACDVLRQGAALHPNDGLPSGRWRLPASLGNGECEMVMFAGHVMARGRDNRGWFYILGAYETQDGVTELTATMHYVDGDDQPFCGRVQDRATITIQVPDKLVGAMTYLAGQGTSRPPINE